jgi:dUTPase
MWCSQVKTGDRIAQLILERISIADVQVVEDLDATHRGEGGFGSTGGFGNQQEAKPTA